ncbi:MAG: YkgJ family cysteine cluster protein [Treponema sp.]|nr:YkgJ family cysteine cluster protein [Treponema sp.]
MPFYASGLRFSCKRCSSCCRYEPGYVFLSENDLGKLAAELKMENNRFIKTYCRWITDINGKEVLSLREKSNKDCILWDSGCSLYTARPLQCSTFPFWKSIAASAQTWKIAASGCPGMNTGELHSGKAIGRYIEMRDLQPVINRQREVQ